VSVTTIVMALVADAGGVGEMLGTRVDVPAAAEIVVALGGLTPVASAGAHAPTVIDMRAIAMSRESLAKFTFVSTAIPAYFIYGSPNKRGETRGLPSFVLQTPAKA
jgi:hypothetical protein